MEENSHNEEKEEEAERIYSHTQWACRPERCFDPNGPGAIFLTEDTETDFSCARVGDIHSHTPLLTQTNSIYTSAMHPKCTCPHRRGVTSIGGVNYGIRETPPCGPGGNERNSRPSSTGDNNTQGSQPNKGQQGEGIYNTGTTAKLHHRHHHVHFDPDVISDQNRSLYTSFKKAVDNPQTTKADGGSDRNELYPLCVISQQPQQIPS